MIGETSSLQTCITTFATRAIIDGFSGRTNGSRDRQMMVDGVAQSATPESASASFKAGSAMANVAQAISPGPRIRLSR